MMSQTKWMITPSGRATAVWQGIIPNGVSLPAQRPFTTTYLEEVTNVTYQVVTEFDLALGTAYYTEKLAGFLLLFH